MERKKDKVYEINMKDIELANKLYVRDYFKDFKYLSPDLIKVKTNDKYVGKNAVFVPIGAGRYRIILRKWFDEIMEGWKQFLYQGSLHGVK